MAFFNTAIENLYIVNGLARSGNHLFISWLITGLSGQTFYFNNIKPTLERFGPDKQIDTKKILKYKTVTRDNKNGKKFEDYITKKLATSQQTEALLIGKRKRIKNCIVSLENKESFKLDEIATLFPKAKNVYKCLVIRDILNLFASRMESETLLDAPNTTSTYWTTDYMTTVYWKENVLASANREYITFNYNHFITTQTFRANLAKKLNINLDKTKLTLNKFGLSKGSSFADKPTTSINQYLTRWKQCTSNKLIQMILRNRDLMYLCRAYFGLMGYEKKMTPRQMQRHLETERYAIRKFKQSITNQRYR